MDPQFDCKSVIFNSRSSTLREGFHGCTHLFYLPRQGDGDVHRVVAKFDDGTDRIIFDIDEIVGQMSGI